MQNNNLSSRALLVSLSMPIWTARKCDLKASDEVTATNEAEAGSGRVWKSLIPGRSSYETCRKLRSELREWHYDNTLPWSADGAQILPSANYFEYISKFKASKAKIETADAAFFDEYPRLREGARRSLGKLFNEGDYPLINNLRDKFSVGVRFLPLPDAEDFRVALGEAEVDKIKQQIQDDVKQAEAEAMKDLWNRLYDAVLKISDRLSAPTAVFRNTLISNLEKLTELLPRLNLTGDEQLDELVRIVKSKLTRYDAESLREDKNLRAVVSARAYEISQTMAFYMGGGK